MVERARSLRREATEAERILWHLLSRYRPGFTRQLVVDRYIVDLACRAAKLAVEIDGSQHHEQADYDAERTRVLEVLGWKVVRLWNSDVLANPDGAAEHILLRTAECLGGTHPQPLPEREGRLRGHRPAGCLRLSPDHTMSSLYLK
ncbi:MAG: hypothetical protein JWN66_4580 [Sphingomonas bacterium]|nr:hypothetical protein [Sphingomonas bacterium]